MLLVLTVCRLSHFALTAIFESQCPGAKQCTCWKSFCVCVYSIKHCIPFSWCKDNGNVIVVTFKCNLYLLYWTSIWFSSKVSNTLNSSKLVDLCIFYIKNSLGTSIVPTFIKVCQMGPEKPSSTHCAHSYDKLTIRWPFGYEMKN